MASNGRHLAVVAKPRLENAGWEIKVRDNLDHSTLIAVISDFISFSISPELNAAGAGAITLSLDTPLFRNSLPNGADASTLEDYEYIWEAYEDGLLRFQWLGRNVEHHQVEDDEQRTVTISGPGIAETLRFAKIMRPGFPKAVPKKMLTNPEFSSGSDEKPAYKWIFPPKWTTMRMWWTLFKSAQKRGTIPWIKPTFTDVKDSGGANWVYVPTVKSTTGVGFSPTAGQDLLDFLDDCTGQDYSTYFAEYTEWMMWPGGKLDVRPVIGVHREREVIFGEGQYQSVEVVRNREEISNVVVAVDNTGNFSVAQDTSSVKHWNRREMYYDAAGNVTQQNRRTAVAKNVLAQNKDEKAEWTIGIPSFLGNRRPFYNFNVGDWIGIDTWHANRANTVSAYRVKAISVTVAGETPEVQLTLQSAAQYRKSQLEKALTWIIHRVGNRPYDPYDDSASTNKTNATFPKNGYVDGIRVFIQPTDPGDTLARPGDLWYDIDYAPQNGYVYQPPTGSTLANWNNGQNPYNSPSLRYSAPDYKYDSGNLNPNVGS
jgi:hypothetical protein